MRVHAVQPEDHDFVQEVAAKVMSTYDGRGINWKHPGNDPEVWKLNSGQRAGVVGVETKGRRCCAKLFYDDRLRARLRNLIGLPKANRAYAHAMKLKQHGIGCPDMIGLVCIKATGPFLVVSELCDYASRTDHYIREHGINSDLVKCFAEFVRQMHGAGVAHIDFSLRNTLVVEDDYSPRYRFLLLDYEDARFYPALSRGKRLSNLHHLLERALPLVSVKWRLVFLREYLQVDSFRDWVEDINALLKKHPSKYTAELNG